MARSLADAVYMKAWRAKNRDRLRDYDAAWRAAHPDRVQEYKRRQAARRTPEQKAAYMKEWRSRESTKDHIRQWKAANRELVRASKALAERRRRARKRKSAEDHRLHDIRLLYVLQEGVCYYCPRSIADYYEVDHIVALARGGSNGVANLALTCRHCNSHKHTIPALEWVLSRRAA